MPAAEMWAKLGAVVLLGCYVLLLTVLSVKFVLQEQETAQELHLERVAWGADEDGSSRLEVEGAGLHADLKAVLVPEALDPSALLAHHLQGEYIRTLAVSKTLLLTVIDRSRLLVWRIPDAGRMQIVGSLNLPGIVRSLAFHGDQVLVGYSSPGGVSLVDLRRPERPVLSRHWQGDGSVQDLLVLGDQLFFVDFYSGLFRLDLNAPDFEPLRLLTMDAPWCLAGAGKRLAVGDFAGRVRWFELDQGGALQPVAEEILAAPIRGLAWQDKRLTAVTQAGRLAVWDMTAWPRLRLAGTLELPGKASCLEPVPNSADLLVGLVVAGFVRVSVDSAGEPMLDGHLFWPINSTALAMAGQRVFANGYDGLEIFALDRIGSMRTTSVRLLHPDYHHLAVWGDVLVGHDGRRTRVLHGSASADTLQTPAPLVLHRGRQVEIFFGDPVQGEADRTLQLPQPVSAVLLAGDLLYVHSGQDLTIFDLGGRNPPQRLAQLGLPGDGGSLKLHPAGYLFVAAEEAGLLVVDVRNPVRPALVARHENSDHLQKYRSMRDLLLIGTTLYTAESAGGIGVFDVADPTNPRRLHSVLTPGYATLLARRHDVLLVADNQAGIFLVDIEESDQPRPIGAFLVPTKTSQMVVLGQSLFVGNEHSGIFQLPLPRRLAGFQVEGDHRARGPLPADAAALLPARVMLYDGLETVTAPLADQAGEFRQPLVQNE